MSFLTRKMGIDAHCFSSFNNEQRKANIFYGETFRITARCFRRFSHLMPESLHPLLVFPSSFSYIYDLSEVISMVKNGILEIEAMEKNIDTEMLIYDLNDFVFFLYEASICGFDKLHFG
jgi:hypothetical protein